MTDEFDFERFLAIPRLSGLRLSPDGRRLVVSVGHPAPDGKSFATALWELDPAGERPTRRLTRSGPGEGAATFLRDGSLVFSSGRPDTTRTAAEQEAAGEASALWLLPGTGGEARRIASPHGGVDAVRASTETDVLVFGAAVHPGTTSLAEDAAREKARTDAGVGARLFSSFPIRYWDHYLGPRERHLYATTLPADPEAPLSPPIDLAPDAGDALREVDFDVTPDGATVVTGWRRDDDLMRPAIDLVAIERATGARRVLAREDAWHMTVRCSPDGRWAVCVRTTNGTPERAELPTLWLVDIATGEGRDLTPDLPLWVHDLAWLPDASAIVGTADRLGNVALFRIDLVDGRFTILGADGAFSDPCPTPDGALVHVLHATMTAPPRVATLSAHHPVDEPGSLPFPGLDASAIGAPGRAERLTAIASDGAEIGSWLILPPGASADAPAPLVLFIHGGPLGSWNSWHWRWNPQLLAARGYAVLMPDPAISTGYGQAMVERGWGRWGDEPYTDLMAALDGALERPDLDAARTAAMGGSFGGYMANWIAGHTDRFRGIVTHASLWELRGFHGTTDHGPSWETEFGDPYLDAARYEAASPHRFLDEIRTPMLVIHGELDYRVPISEGLRLWTDLQRHGVPSRFLHFPDENHWILKPQNARLWYATVLAFLDETVLGKPWQAPDLL